MQRKKQEESNSNASDIAQISAASVGGYLRNAAHRQRVPRAEGGKGTRRKVAMVTSKHVEANATPKTETSPEVELDILAADDVRMEEEEEWDEVEIPGLSLGLPSKMEPLTALKAETKKEGDASASPTIKVESRRSTTLSNPVDALLENFESLTGPERNTEWGRSDPAYEEMRERRDQLTAQRRSERMQKVFEQVTELIAVFTRGRFLWREARHPRLLHRLLRLRWQREGEGTSSLVMLQAVLSARPLVEAAKDPKNTKPSLAPAWVTLEQDGIHNATSNAILTLLEAVNTCFHLDLPEVHQADPSSDAVPSFSRWSVPLERGFLNKALGGTHCPVLVQPIVVPHPLYLCIVFLSLAALSGLESRLVIAKESKPQHERRLPTRKAAADKTPALLSKKKPSNCFWLEVWCAERQSYISVNPCKGVTTVWGAGYTFSFGNGRVVDSTARYTSTLSKSYMYSQRLGRCTNYRFLWQDKISWDDTREVVDVLIEACCKGVRSADSLQEVRERRQLESLHYSEKVPTTLSLLHRHPLFVIESDISRTEGIYPKDKFHTVGSVKGHTVFKRSAVQQLRSRDGWLRERRSLLEDVAPYKVVPPPASRPFAPPSSFFGYWQTKPFAPLRRTEDGSLPQHGNSKWYILLSDSPPEGIAHLTEPNIVRVARRMQVDFRLAVVGFVHQKLRINRRGTWSGEIHGIVVRSEDREAVQRAYQQWVKMCEEQAAARRRERALQWWLLFSQRLLAVDRLQAMYAKGSHYAFPMQ